MQISIRTLAERVKDADAATHFLEEEVGELNIIGITNIRDIPSHIAALVNNCINRDERLEQLAHIKEHLRKSILQPYYRAVDKVVADIEKIKKEYISIVIPKIENEIIGYVNFPNQIILEAQQKSISELITSGRKSQSEGKWNVVWEEGIKSFIEAYRKGKKLKEELSKALEKVHLEEKVKLEKKAQQKREFVLMLLGAIIGAIISVIITLLLT